MSESGGYPGAPPGWYPDPAGGPGQRWWDGYAWTEATVLPQHPPPPPWAGAGPPQGPATEVAPWAVASQRLTDFNATGLVNEEMWMVPVARVAVVMPAVYYLVTLVLQRVNADQLRSAGHQLRLDWHAAQNGQPAPQFHGSSGFSPINLIVGLLALAAVVVACMWQHRAASAARALGVPSRRSPGWGVGAWFVPVVNLWVPYSAIRDCLPPDDPHRPRVLHWWIAWLVAGWVSAAAGVVRALLHRDCAGPVHPGGAGLPGRHRVGTGDRDGDRGRPSGIGRAPCPGLRGAAGLSETEGRMRAKSRTHP